MNNTTNNSPNTIEELQQECELLVQQNAELAAKLRWYEVQYRLSKQRLFGSSSERTTTNPD